MEPPASKDKLASSFCQINVWEGGAKNLTRAKTSRLILSQHTLNAIFFLRKLDIQAL
jgi:hypothetical protein